VATSSLYRRYRPRRFAELKGQDHVVRALRDAVAGGREGQAYLFSGPRGTGKTSSARILAKVLNCERPVDGEPCCECPSCLAVERGTSYDVHELDAASNNGVDAMRDLIERASLGTPGRHKVYILDEVHMLSKAAEAALLKTLEEPPPHVVSVLATTDPQRVSDTIRSRTQHLRFHLLPAETLAEHVRWIVADAGLDVSEVDIDAALAQGAGSARDTLSALELIANAGSAAGDTLSFDEFLEAFIDHDPGRALTAMASAVNAGHEPRTIAEALIRHLRNGFLSLMAPDLVQLSQHQLDALSEQARRLGPARIVRGIERLGEILVELRHAPDPRVLVEVALVQLSAEPDAGSDDVGALAARLTALEQTVAERATAGPGPTPIDPSTGRAVLGGRAQKAAVRTEPPRSEAGAAITAEPAAVVAPVAPVSGALEEQWTSLRPTLKGRARALYTPVDLVGASDGEVPVVTLAVPNATHQTKCEEHRDEVEQAWRAAAGRPIKIELVVRDEPSGPGGADPSVREPLEPEDLGDLGDLVDAPAGPAQTAAERLAQAFPGAQLVEGSE
jgi:DNA polymerase-3 subunit gamma/tau